MKRTITVLLTVALIGSLMFMGFAGTAAAGGHDHGEDASANVDQGQNVAQQNNNDQRIGLAFAGDDVEQHNNQRNVNTQRATAEAVDLNAIIFD